MDCLNNMYPKLGFDILVKVKQNKVVILD